MAEAAKVNHFYMTHHMRLQLVEAGVGEVIAGPGWNMF